MFEGHMVVESDNVGEVDAVPHSVEVTEVERDSAKEGLSVTLCAPVLDTDRVVTGESVLLRVPDGQAVCVDVGRWERVWEPLPEGLRDGDREGLVLWEAEAVEVSVDANDGEVV